MAGKNFGASIDEFRKLEQRALSQEIGFVIRKRQKSLITRRSVKMEFRSLIFLKLAK